jgi:dolichyl-phosphate-mannose--protein O-mannosyl transferase
VPGVTLAEATLWLGVMPLAVYALTYLPAYGIRGSMLGDIGLVAQHQTMLALQESVIQPHTYQSVWYQWLLDLRPIWYLYEEVDGAQRGVLLIGNPLTMLLGLPAMAWCALAAWRDRRWDCAAVAVLFAVSLGFWIAVHKPVQFYYHYFLPSCFLLAALGMALDRLWQQGWRKLSLGTLAASLALFAWFYPILAAMPLSGPQSFTTWMWLDSWR